MDILTAARQLQVAPDQLRQWERQGLVPPITRQATGLRDYSAHDLAWLRHVKQLVDLGVQPDFLVEYVKLVQLGPLATPARQALVAETKQRLTSRCQRLRQVFDTMEAMVVRWQRGTKSDEH